MAHPEVPSNSLPRIPDLDHAISRLRTCRHGLMLFLAADQIIGRALELYGEFSESENRVMMPFVRPGDVVIDVGANVGTVTLPLSRRVGDKGRVYAFEPQRIIFQHLCANVVLNGLLNVDVRCAAVGASSGMASIPALNPTAPENFGGVRVSTETTGESVPLVRLDDLGLAACSLIKLDVEGMESEVLRGAAQTVLRHRPVIYLEAESRANTRTCLFWLLERSYRLYWHFAPFFEPTNFHGRKENAFANSGDINALAIPKERDVNVRLPTISGPDADWKIEYKAWLGSK
jgi:FkbM family methyltransferase